MTTRQKWQGSQEDIEGKYIKSDYIYIKIYEIIYKDINNIAS